jgi:hypothetical protein
MAGAVSVERPAMVPALDATVFASQSLRQGRPSVWTAIEERACRTVAIAKQNIGSTGELDASQVVPQCA